MGWVCETKSDDRCIDSRFVQELPHWFPMQERSRWRCEVDNSCAHERGTCRIEGVQQQRCGKWHLKRGEAWPRTCQVLVYPIDVARKPGENARPRGARPVRRPLRLDRS